jgi:hypothetical protein
LKPEWPPGPAQQAHNAVIAVGHVPGELQDTALLREAFEMPEKRLADANALEGILNSQGEIGAVA